MSAGTTLAPTDAERLEFEAWLQPYWSRAQRISGDGDSVYIEDWVQGAWVGWSTARRAPAPASQPVAVASDSGPSLANDPRLCCRSHPHEKQSLHCQLREVAAWLRWHAAAGKTPSADSMRAHAEQVDAMALELRAVPAGMEPVATVTCEGVMGVSFTSSSSYGCDLAVGTKLYTEPQVQAMLAKGLAPGWQSVPVEPTSEMVIEAYKAQGEATSSACEEIYRAMLAAAPSGPAREG